MPKPQERASNDIYATSDGLFGRLRAASEREWRAYTDHGFVRRLADGTLPEAAFRHYLIQDYLFLIHFARAYGLAVYKSENLDDMRYAAGAMSAIVDTEIALHVKFCAGWGLTEAEMAEVPEDTACVAYTRYVLEKGQRGDLLDLHVAIAPCVVGYGEIGLRLALDPRTKLGGNPYREWVEMYADDAYQPVT